MSTTRQKLAIAGGAILIVAVTAVSGLIYIKSEQLKTRVIREIIARVQPHVPFKIESVTLDASWKDLREGKIRGLRAVLDWPEINSRAHLGGPVTIDGGRVTYTPTLALTIHRRSLPPIPIAAHLELLPAFQGIRSATLEAEVDAIPWPPLGVTLEKLKLQASARDGRISSSFSIAKLAWTDPAAPDSRMGELGGVDLAVETTYSEDPFRLSPKLTAALKSGGLELLRDALYLDLPLAQLPVEIEADREAGRATLRFPRGEVVLTRDGTAQLATFSIRRAPLTALLAAVKTSSPFASLISYQWHEGTLSTQGRVKLDSSRSPDIAARIDVNGVGMTRPEHKLALRGVQARADMKYAQGSLSVPRFEIEGRGRLRRIDFTLAKTRFQLSDRRVQSSGPLPLKITVAGSPVPLEIGEISGPVGGRKTFELATSVRLRESSLAPLLQGACIPPRGPEVLVRLDFPTVEVTSAYVDLTGEARARTLGGEVVVREIGFFDLDTPVVETYFSAEWSGLQLDQLGRHFRFGKMDGEFQGYARDAVLVSWLPTQYDFRAEVKPSKKSDVVFSPDAMRNFVKLISGYDIDELPGVLNWFIFRWPSRILGGYDVDYAGISMFARDGSILLETLDPPEVLESERKHFILYGGRFKMPLRSSRYPVVLDTTGVGNFAMRMIRQLEAISKKSESETESSTKTGSDTSEKPESVPCPAPQIADL